MSDDFTPSPLDSKMGTLTITQVHFLWKKQYFYIVTVGDAPLVSLF